MHANTRAAVSRAKLSDHAAARMKERGLSLEHFDFGGAVEPAIYQSPHKILVPRKPDAPAGPDVWMIIAGDGTVITVYAAADGITAAGVITGTSRLAAAYLRAAGQQLRSDPAAATAELLCALARA